MTYSLLQFQIQHITSSRLQRELFATFAPALAATIAWEDLPKNNRDRGVFLAEAIRNFSNVDKHQYDDLCAALGTIDIIGHNQRETQFLEREIERGGLWDSYYLDDFGLKKHSHTTHNILAWIAIKSGSPCAAEIWRRLRNQSIVLAEEAQSYVFYLTETSLTDLDIKARTENFRSAYREFRSEQTGILDYPVIADCCVHFEYVRYTVNMAPNPHLSVQFEGEEFDSKLDKNADSFRIDHYPARNYLKISRVTDKKTSAKIAAIFAESALGAKVQDQKARRYSLAQFGYAQVTSLLELPPEYARAKDEVWISALRCMYLDRDGNILSKNLEFDFPYSRTISIYDNIRMGYPMSQETRELVNIGRIASKREILGVSITFHLHQLVRMADGRVMHSDKFLKPFSINVSPTSSNYLGAIRDLDPEHRELVLDILKRCDILPKKSGELVVSD